MSKKTTPTMSHHAADQFLLDQDSCDYEDISRMIRINRGHGQSPVILDDHAFRYTDGGYDDSDFS